MRLSSFCEGVTLKLYFLHDIVILKTEASLQAREGCRQTQMLTSAAAAGCVWVLTDPVLVVSSLTSWLAKLGHLAGVEVWGFMAS